MLFLKLQARTCSNRDDAYKRKMQRIKVRSIPHRFHTRPALHRLKLGLLIIVLTLSAMFLWSSTNCNQNSVFRWMWDCTNHRYVSDLNINWEEISHVLNQFPGDGKHQEIGLLNFNANEIHQWEQLIPKANHTVLNLNYADENVTWESFYPNWIDEAQEDEVPRCPSLPMLEVPRRRLNLIAVKLPCQSTSWSRDVARFHLQIASAHLATSHKGNYPVYILFVTPCFPMPNLFHCNDLVAHEGTAWLYKPNLSSLREKLRLPIGSCELAIPFEAGKEANCAMKNQREAYATILHSADIYVCGAIVAAQSIRMSKSTRDLVILVDESINEHDRRGLRRAGWQVRTIQRIRNPKAEKDTYNEWNYSKFRLWQLTDYDKIIFIDADMLILRNIDFLFGLPEVSATWNNGPLFNSGVMVVEPSNCTFRMLMDHVDEIRSYNGGDQGYLNEVFTWWHRLPRRMNFLKHFWSGDGAAARERKDRMFGAEPAEVYVIHYLGNKPWMCYRDYDCNWNVETLREFASDAAHGRWWKVHDEMEEELRGFCMLRTVQKAQLEVDRRDAEAGNWTDGHWRREIGDERVGRCKYGERQCNWKGMLNHWVKKKTTP